MPETEPNLSPVLEQIDSLSVVREISVGLGSGSRTDPHESQPWAQVTCTRPQYVPLSTIWILGRYSENKPEIIPNAIFWLKKKAVAYHGKIMRATGLFQAFSTKTPP